MLSIGHRLVNLVARALMCDPDLQSAIAPRLKKWSDALTPFSDDREAWLHLNGTNVGTLRAAISGSPHKSVRSLVEPLRVLTQTPAWQQLHAQRDEDFHRWRKESAHLAGVDKSSGHLRDVLGYDGRVIGKAFGAERAPYTAADGREDDLAKVTREALDLVGGTVEKVVTALEGALEPLSKGQIIGRDEYSKQGGGEMVFHQNEFSVYLMRPLMWDAADCSCCRH